MSSWIYGNRYLSMAEMTNNAWIVYYRLSAYGWTDEAISAILANMQYESSINPGIWESLDAYAGGYGLVQWTPYTKYSSWAGTNWQNNGDRQCERIKYELDNGLQWDKTSHYVPAQYKMDFADFVQSHEDVGYLAKVWLYCYEKPRDPASKEQERDTAGRYWYSVITGEEPPEPPEPPSPTGNVPIWLLFKFNEGR